MAKLSIVRLEVDELEALRLCDFEDCDQEEAGERMGVSRGTIYRLLKSGRSKLLRAILNSQALVIAREAKREQEARGDTHEDLPTDS